MKTDALFYELFQLYPQSLFDLVCLKMEGEYIFESITVKTTEKRFDGFFKRIDNQGPNVFLVFSRFRDFRLVPCDKLCDRGGRMDNFQKSVASRTNNHVKAIGIQCEDKFIVKEPERSPKTGDQNKS